jgi:hypothetical protein
MRRESEDENDQGCGCSYSIPTISHCPLLVDIVFKGQNRLLPSE